VLKAKQVSHSFTPYYALQKCGRCWQTQCFIYTLQCLPPLYPSWQCFIAPVWGAYPNTCTGQSETEKRSWPGELAMLPTL